MSPNIPIAKQLETLTALYQHGYKSDLIEQSLSKIINLELHHAQEQATHLKRKLLTYESQYKMDSEQFYKQFMAGELGDAMDFLEWSAFYEMWHSVQDRIKVLGHSS
ncbi:MAG: hypothetical protein VKL20_01165 [Synechocystis sp.]|nr:hypothetical protein [Synechocystis sp.]